MSIEKYEMKEFKIEIPEKGFNYVFTKDSFIHSLLQIIIIINNDHPFRYTKMILEDIVSKINYTKEYSKTNFIKFKLQNALKGDKRSFRKDLEYLINFSKVSFFHNDWGWSTKYYKFGE